MEENKSATPDPLGVGQKTELTSCKRRIPSSAPQRRWKLRMRDEMVKS